MTRAPHFTDDWYRRESLRSEIMQIEFILSEIGDDEPIERASFEARLEGAKAELRKLPIRSTWTP